MKFWNCCRRMALSAPIRPFPLNIRLSAWIIAGNANCFPVEEFPKTANLFAGAPEPKMLHRLFAGLKKFRGFLFCLLAFPERGGYYLYIHILRLFVQI